MASWLHIMRKLISIGLFLAGLVLGGGIATWRCVHVFSAVAPSTMVDAASIAAFEAEWLARLRLNEVESAIKDIENCMDIQVSTLAKWNEASSPDEKTRKARDRWLVPVKIYHESLTGDDAARIKSLLATIPGGRPNSACKSGVCRLNDLHLGAFNLNTNRPTKPLK